MRATKLPAGVRLLQLGQERRHAADGNRTPRRVKPRSGRRFASPSVLVYRFGTRALLLLLVLSRAYGEEAYGSFQFTFYWVAHEREARGTPDAYIYDASCGVLGKTTLAFLRSLALEGTGELEDGRTLNFDARCACGWAGVPCFREIAERWGIGVEGRRLRPFRSVASDPAVVPTGTVLYIPDLDGVDMPGEPPWGGFVHDGCVVADDRGSAIGGAQLDFFVGRRDLYKLLDKRLHRPAVRVYGGDQRCRAAPE